MEYDILVIGAGVIGNAAARELTRRNLSVLVLEKEADTAFGISCRNSGVVHSGIHYEPGSLRARFSVEGNRMLEPLCNTLKTAFRRTGKITLASAPDEINALYRLKEQGETNGVPGLEILEAHQMEKIQPGIGGIKGLYSPSTGIINPMAFTINLAEHAMQEGAEYRFLHEVTAVSQEKDFCTVTCSTPEGTQCISARILVNCAGLSADKIARMTGFNDHPLYPCRGEYYVLDKRLSGSLNSLIYPIPGAHSGGLGIHLTTTTEGNILIGPSNEYISDRENFSSSREIMELLKKEARALLPSLETGDFIRSFSGIRPKLTPPEVGGYDDFVITARGCVIHLIGIESPGLTSAPAVAEYVGSMVDGILNPGVKTSWNPSFNQQPGMYRMPYPLSSYPADIRKSFLEEDPDYGTIICRCEGITKAEVISAVRRISGPVTLIGIKQRCRTMTGRCQGGFCLPRITEMLQEEGKDILYRGITSPLYAGPLRGGKHVL